MIKTEFTTNLLNFSTIPLLKTQTTQSSEAEIVFKDSAVISASDKYKKPTALKNIFGQKLSQRMEHTNNTKSI